MHAKLTTFPASKANLGSKNYCQTLGRITGLPEDVAGVLSQSVTITTSILPIRLSVSVSEAPKAIARFAADISSELPAIRRKSFKSIATRAAAAKIG